jgi:hypothetical protein
MRVFVWHFAGGNRSPELWTAEGDEALCSRSIPGREQISFNWVCMMKVVRTKPE